MAGPLIDRSQLEEAFHQLAEQLRRDNVVGDIYIFGGAAMVVAYKARQATRDVDALFEPREKVHRAAVKVAEQLGLPRWWLNDQATSYLSRVPDDNAPVIFDHPNLRVSAVSPDHLLAMKALAARAYADLDDIALLSERLGITDLRQIEAICARIYPEEPLSDRARLVIEDVLEKMAQRLRPRQERGQDHDPGLRQGPEGPGLSL
jgi:hypothetical protein